MSLEKSLVELQRMIARAWGTQVFENKQHSLSQNSLSQNEFDYLMCIHIAQSTEPDPDETKHDDSTHLSALAADMQVKKSSASLMLNKHQKSGLVERVTCRYDARAQHDLLTEKGETLFLACQQRVYTLMTDLIKSKLATSEYVQFEQLLEKVCR
ncbi:MAG: hypothetical protein MJK04_10505 [Psychrosphaera sp.]|nr:hypothetical protein [Psychrosphaera sp.]